MFLRPNETIGSYAVHALTGHEHERWDAFVQECPEASFFHRAGWRTVIERSFGHRTHYLFAERDGVVKGVLPLVEIKSALFGHALISNGFCVAGGPIAAEDGARAALDARAEDLLRRTGARYLEYRNPVKPKESWSTRVGLYAGFSGPLPAAEDINLKQIPRKQRAVVRKAIESNLTWNVEKSIDRLWDLYAVSVRNLGTPVFGKSYFANLLNAFGSDCDVLTVSSEGTPVASVLNFYFKGRVMPFYTGSIPSARRLGANDLMYWRLMRHAAARGCTVFDFGRSKVGTGPYDFKKNWGFAPQPIVHQFLLPNGGAMPENNPLNPKYRLMIATWKHLPLFVANRLGPLVVRNIG
ncbi:MAG: FemAB family PEP-CTERM system-associated protein [Rhodospirillaceae bacterium]|nr:FemAB family PEP-CTERM system-associated protein [Rhodospirillaceae bacterium]